ncbi:MAG: shikimate kinase [Oscillospiraceae bacterium]|nr:shikimate kinase [Oscillospiraceae bacterium]
MNCGLLGRKLGHSYSPQIHARLGDYSYCLFQKEPEEIENFLKHGDFTGLNVTIPYKKAVIPYLDELSPIARKLGAVNTVVRRADGTLFGHNTDYFGFASMVQRSGLSVAGKKVLVLGSGGASSTAAAVMRELGAAVIVISRSGENNYGNLSLHADAAVIANTTPVGMYPDTGISPVDLSLFPSLEGVLDLIYNPARTQLLLDAEKRGIIAENGLWMLVAQAKEAAEVFTGTQISDAVIERTHRMLQQQMGNIVLIGMPGCGKTTVGQLLAAKTGKPFADSDALIEELAGKPIPQIFAQDGEDVFRQWETKALKQLGKQSGLVIATGGGCVTREHNRSLLRQNGIVVWLKRDIDQLPTVGRPLSQTNPLSELYQIRKPLYKAFADLSVHNNGSPDETVLSILNQLEE